MSIFQFDSLIKVQYSICQQDLKDIQDKNISSFKKNNILHCNFFKINIDHIFDHVT